ncbi:MAG: M81 family metallopeptidase [Opitutaceae bacterium]|nr:M81 family metallopeptidase [Opitutaceae bacterium]
MKPRILFAGLFHETHTFLDGVTRWEDFEVICDRAILAKAGDSSPTDGFLEEAARQGWEVIPTIDARATPSAVVEDAMLERYWSEFERRARPALAAGVEGIFLVLHGAMATQNFPDTEGELLARIRALPGAAQVPIFGVLDLHANVSARMCELANGLVMYRENPHTDARQATVRGAALLGRCLKEKRVPRMHWCRPPVMWAPPGTGTHADPMLSLKIFAHKLETLHPDVWACNIAAGYSFADTPDTGCSLSIVTTADAAAARGHLETGGRLAWSLRTRGTVEYPGVDEVVAGLQTAPAVKGPVILVEPSDNIGGGAPGDCTGALRSLIKHGLERCLAVINDPETVASLASAAIGERRRLAVGGRGSRLDPGPVELDAVLVSRSDGRFTLEDKQSHLASMNGVNIAMGDCAVVRSGGVTLLLTSRKTAPFDLGQLRSQGLEPRDFAVIVVKAAVAHKRAYDKITGASYYVDTPGPCTSNLASLPWRRLRRPVYPLDPITQPEFLYA